MVAFVLEISFPILQWIQLMGSLIAFMNGRRDNGLFSSVILPTLHLVSFWIYAYDMHVQLLLISSAYDMCICAHIQLSPWSPIHDLSHLHISSPLHTVCTTEIGRLALKYDQLEEMGVKVATLSVDPVKSHNDWLKDVVAHCENEIDIKFPIIGDQVCVCFVKIKLLSSYICTLF